MNWSTALYTDTGMVRKTNEDAVVEIFAEQLWAVADGMGGHEAGDYASQYVVNSLMNYEQSLVRGVSMQRLSALLRHSNSHLVEKAMIEGRGIIGCTVAVISIHGDQVICSWSGDSRIYRLRSTELLQLTRDHTFQSIDEDRDCNAEGYTGGGKPHMLTSAIGGDSAFHIEHCCFSLVQGDRFLICTDGMYKEVSDKEMEQTLLAKNSPEEAINTLSEMYQCNGARDNVGAICLYLH